MDWISTARPSDSPFVEKVYHVQSEYASTFTSQAEYHWEMVITKYQGRTSLTIRGPETEASHAECPPDAEFLGIIFKTGIYMPHLPLSKLKNRNDFTLPEATNQSFWLLGMAWQLPTFENADTFVNRMIREDLLVRDPVVEAVLHNQQPDMSLRTIQRRFLNATGLTHKTIQQIERAQRATELLRQGQPILDTAFETGYFDQSHLTNDLKRLMGQTPAQILQLG